MLTEERYEKILMRLEEKQSVTVNELAEIFSVSTETIRRDLVFLESKGQVKRVFGGAVRGAGLMRFHDYSERLIENRDKKIDLCLAAAELIEERDILAVDAGSTAAIFADTLREKFKQLTVITASMDVFDRLKDKFTVILSGGEYYEKEHSFIGELTLSTIGRLHADKCFIFPSAVSVEYGVEDYVPLVFPVQKKLIEISGRVMILADSTKYGKRALIKISDASPDFIYVTDSGLDETLYKEYSESIYILKGSNKIK